MMCITTALSQSKSPFDNYHKLSLQFGVSKYIGAETSPLPTTLNYSLIDYLSPHFGFSYDVLQKNNVNLKIGLSTLLVTE